MTRELGWGDERIGAKAAAALMDDLLGEEEPEAPKKKATKKKRAKRKPKEPKEEPKEDLLALLETVEDPIPPEPPEAEKTEAVAESIGIDLASECSVCRSLEGCECEEEDRTFQRRVRWEEDVKKTARCSRCGSPMSVVYLPRPGARPPYRLPCFSALWACALCHGAALATAILGLSRARPPA